MHELSRFSTVAAAGSVFTALNPPIALAPQLQGWAGRDLGRQPRREDAAGLDKRLQSAVDVHRQRPCRSNRGYSVATVRERYCRIRLAVILMAGNAMRKAMNEAAQTGANSLFVASTSTDWAEGTSVIAEALRCP